MEQTNLLLEKLKTEAAVASWVEETPHEGTLGFSIVTKDKEISDKLLVACGDLAGKTTEVSIVSVTRQIMHDEYYAILLIIIADDDNYKEVKSKFENLYTKMISSCGMETEVITLNQKYEDTAFNAITIVWADDQPVSNKLGLGIYGESKMYNSMKIIVDEVVSVCGSLAEVSEGIKEGNPIFYIIINVNWGNYKNIMGDVESRIDKVMHSFGFVG